MPSIGRRALWTYHNSPEDRPEDDQRSGLKAVLDAGVVPHDIARFGFGFGRQEHGGKSGIVAPLRDADVSHHTFLVLPLETWEVLVSDFQLGLSPTGGQHS